MGKLKAQKVMSTDTNGFNETKEFEVLNQSHMGVNHNKFYCLELQFNSRTGSWRLFSHYGRLGKTNIYDVRGPSDDEAAVRKEYKSILDKKKKGKKVQRDDGTTEIEKYERIETVIPSVGSDNLRKSSTVTIKTVDHIDKKAYSDPHVSRIIDQVTQENIHNITSNTTLKLTSNGFETPLGPVTKAHVDRARQPLMTLKGLLQKVTPLNVESKEVEKANNEYMTLIPHYFGHKITEDDWILDDMTLMKEFDLLDQLETAVQMGSAMANASQRMSALGTDVEPLDDTNEFDRIVNKFRKSKADNHRHTNVYGYEIKNIFRIKIPEEREVWEKKGKPLGNVKELFHGSQNCNILSILKNGLIIPSCNSSHVTGRAFGDGIYAAHNSTKALNYSIGFWSSRKNKFKNSFLFLTKFAMGKKYEVYDSCHGAPRGYDSIHAKSGQGLWNDEYIVYKLFQSSLHYLCELESH